MIVGAKCEVLWACAGCGVDVVRATDGAPTYRVPPDARGRRWYLSHRYADGNPAETPSHIFDDVAVCEFCHHTCPDCGEREVSATLKTADVTDDGAAFPLPAFENNDFMGATKICVDCYRLRVQACCGRLCMNCDGARCRADDLA